MMASLFRSSLKKKMSNYEQPPRIPVEDTFSYMSHRSADGESDPLASSANNIKAVDQRQAYQAWKAFNKFLDKSGYSAFASAIDPRMGPNAWRKIPFKTPADINAARTFHIVNPSNAAQTEFMNRAWKKSVKKAYRKMGVPFEKTSNELISHPLYSIAGAGKRMDKLKKAISIGANVGLPVASAVGSILTGNIPGAIASIALPLAKLGISLIKKGLKGKKKSGGALPTNIKASDLKPRPFNPDSNGNVDILSLIRQGIATAGDTLNEYSDGNGMKYARKATKLYYGSGLSHVLLNTKKTSKAIPSLTMRRFLKPLLLYKKGIKGATPERRAEIKQVLSTIPKDRPLVQGKGFYSDLLLATVQSFLEYYGKEAYQVAAQATKTIASSGIIKELGEFLKSGAIKASKYLFPRVLAVSASSLLSNKAKEVADTNPTASTAMAAIAKVLDDAKNSLTERERATLEVEVPPNKATLNVLSKALEELSDKHSKSEPTAAQENVQEVTNKAAEQVEDAMQSVRNRPSFNDFLINSGVLSPSSSSAKYNPFEVTPSAATTSSTHTAYTKKSKKAAKGDGWPSIAAIEARGLAFNRHGTPDGYPQDMDTTSKTKAGLKVRDEANPMTIEDQVGLTGQRRDKSAKVVARAPLPTNDTPLTLMFQTPPNINHQPVQPAEPVKQPRNATAVTKTIKRVNPMPQQHYKRLIGYTVGSGFRGIGRPATNVYKVSKKTTSSP